jgi:hypothetical protein
MERVKIGLFAGLIAVGLTTAANIVARWLGWLPEAMDMKQMAALFVDPAARPALAFGLGVVLHILSGGAMGILYVLVFRRRTALTGIVFMLGSWLVMMLVVFPLTGRGAWGLAASPAMPLATFTLSVLYGAAVGLLAGRWSAGWPAGGAPASSPASGAV